MSTGEVLRVRAAMKPISTVPRALRTIDIATGEAAVAHHQRSDVCAVPAAGVVAEAMVALVLADAVLEKFGGDSLAETAPQHRGVPRRRVRDRGLGRSLPVSPRVVLIGAARLRQDDRRRRCSPTGSALPFRDTDADVEARTGKPIARHLRRRRRAVLPRRWRPRRCARRSTRTAASCRSAAARSCDAETRTALDGHHVVCLDVDAADAASRVGLNDRASAAARQRAAAQLLRSCTRAARPLYDEVGHRHGRRTVGRTAEEIADAHRQGSRPRDRQRASDRGTTTDHRRRREPVRRRRRHRPARRTAGAARRQAARGSP